MMGRRHFICGIPVDVYDRPSMLARMIDLAQQNDTQHHICYLNAHVHNLARRDTLLRQTLQESTICYADGASIVWAARRIGAELGERMTAADFFPEYLENFADAGLRVFFLGGRPGVAEDAVQTLRTRLPHFEPVGTHHGYLQEQDHARVIQLANESEAQIVVLGMGSPLQEHWIAHYRKRLRAPLVWAVGALLDYSAGVEQRCPAWMGNNGLEWLYRLSRQPRRMASRYLLGNPQFVWAVLTSSATKNNQPPSRSSVGT